MRLRRLSAPMLARFLLAGLGLAATGLVACDRGDDGPAAPRVAPGVARATNFRVVYRVDDTAGDRPMVSTDVIQVALPWNGRLERLEGPPPGGTVLLSNVQNQRFSFNTSEGSIGFNTRRIPGVLHTTPSPEVLEAAAEAGLVDRLGDATVAGETCTRWAYQGVNRVLAKPALEERVEVCITPDGVPVREAITLRGKLARLSEAVQIDRDPPVTAETFQTDRDPSTEGDGLFETEQQVTEGEQSGKGIVKVTAPEGFRPARSVTVVRQAGPGSPPISLYVQAFESGPDLVTTEQVTTPGNPPWSADEGAAIDLGDQRTGTIVYRAGWAEVRLSVGGKSVRVTSARPVLAVAVAKTLRV
jgi:hypothetical protein